MIVRKNGSGKTTLSKIIAGIYQPESGQVLYDGEDVGSYAKDSFYRKFSVIQQSFVKYPFTVRENIGISLPSRIHNDERLMKSARAAGIEGAVQRDWTPAWEGSSAARSCRAGNGRSWPSPGG